VESSRDAILMLDSQRGIVTYNSAFEELFGYEKGELKGKSVRVLHPSEESLVPLERLPIRRSSVQVPSGRNGIFGRGTAAPSPLRRSPRR